MILSTLWIIKAFKSFIRLQGTFTAIITILQKNKNDTYQRPFDETLQRFTCAHELGHSLLHHDINTTFLKSKTLFSTSKIEREANTFAVELLMPDTYLYELEDTNLTIYDAAKMYGVPKEVSNLKDL